MDRPVFTTLDEKVSDTIVSSACWPEKNEVSSFSTLICPLAIFQLRDLKQVGSKLKVVLLPREDQEGILKQLKEWDLWGPLMVCLTLSIMLSITAPEDQKALVFAGVFVIVWIGAAIVTLNAQLLGGTISFFQSVCILGYCVFPLDVACFVCLLFKALFTSTLFIKLIVVAVGFVWSTRGMQEARNPSRLDPSNLLSTDSFTHGYSNCLLNEASVVFMKQIIAPERKVLAVYPVFFFYTFISWMVLIS